MTILIEIEEKSRMAIINTEHEMQTYHVDDTYYNQLKVQSTNEQEFKQDQNYNTLMKK